MSRYRWALRPGWILSHLFVLGCIVLFVNLSLWQWHRLQTRRESNALIEARQQADPAPIAEVLTRTASADQIAASTFRSVTVSGTYDVEDQILVRNRTNQGAPGYWVITPLTLPDGTAVAVNRGWIPLPAGEPAGRDSYEPPEGPVRVVGFVQDTQRQEGLGISDPPDGRLPVLSRVDVGRLQAQMSTPLFPVYVNLKSQDPASASALPDPVPLPELDDGPHLNYTGQWLIFATLTAIVYPLLLRRNAANRDKQNRTGRSTRVDGDGEVGGVDGYGATPVGASEPAAGRAR